GRFVDVCQMSRVRWTLLLSRLIPCGTGAHGNHPADPEPHQFHSFVPASGEPCNSLMPPVASHLHNLVRLLYSPTTDELFHENAAALHSKTASHVKDSGSPQGPYRRE